jgi:hypothetical protein
MVIFAYDCAYSSYNFSIPSIAYFDIILQVLYTLMVIIVGVILSLFNPLLN